MAPHFPFASSRHLFKYLYSDYSVSLPLLLTQCLLFLFLTSSCLYQDVSLSLSSFISYHAICILPPLSVSLPSCLPLTILFLILLCFWSYPSPSSYLSIPMCFFTAFFCPLPLPLLSLSFRLCFFLFYSLFFSSIAHPYVPSVSLSSLSRFLFSSLSHFLLFPLSTHLQGPRAPRTEWWQSYATTLPLHRRSSFSSHRSRMATHSSANRRRLRQFPASGSQASLSPAQGKPTVRHVYHTH